MSVAMTVIVAIKALRRNAMRTALTALGMIIGVAAVIVMVAIGTGARTSIEAQIRSAGSNIVTINAGSGGFGPVRQGQGAVTTLTADDASAIRSTVPGIRYLSPGINTRTQIVAETSNWNTQIQGTSEELPELRSWPVQMGSYFSAQDVRARSQGRRARLGDARSVVRAWRRSHRRDRPHQQPAVPGCRCAEYERVRPRWGRTRTTS